MPGRGELFVRDTGGPGPAVLLLHGWMFPSDLNWLRVYAPLVDAGYRVLAMDLRGHGRGLRTAAAFRLADCADDAAGLLGVLGVERALVAGYSMGGPVTALLARRHPEQVAGIVLCATALDWSDRRQKVFWRTMGLLRLVLGVFPLGVWRAVVRLQARGVRGGEEHLTWVAAELSRSSARDLAEAGRELGRFDSSGWVGDLVPAAAVVLTARDRAVPPRKQRALARALGVEPHVVDADHDACSVRPREFVAALLDALRSVSPTGPAAVATEPVGAAQTSSGTSFTPGSPRSAE